MFEEVYTINLGVENKKQSKNRKRPNKKNTIYLHYRIRQVYRRVREA